MYKKTIAACFFMLMLVFSFKLSAEEIQAPAVDKPTPVEIKASPVEVKTPAEEIKTPASETPSMKDETKPVIETPNFENKSAPLAKEASKEAVLKGAEIEYCLKYNPDKWEVIENKVNPNAEFLLKAKNREAYALIIPEKTPVLLEHMPEVIKFNAQKAGMKDAAILKQEMKKVNGQDVLFVEWEGTFDPVNAKIVYEGVIYSGDKGTVQVYAYTTKANIDEFRQDMQDFINGFCIVDTQAKPAA